MKKELPDGWDAYKLNDLLVSHKAGTWGEESDVESGIPVIRSTNFTKDLKLGLENIAYRIVSSNDLEKKILEFGDILLEKSGGGPSQPVGRVVLFDIKSDNTFVCGNFIQFLRVNKDLICPKFLYYWLSDIHKKGATIPIQNKTTGIRNLRLKAYMEIEIPVPPLETQHKIVAIFEKAEETKKLRAHADGLTQQFLKSVFLEMFGDPINNHHAFKIGKIGDLLTKTQYGTSQKANEEEKGIPILRMNNITYEGNWNFTSLKHIEFELKDREKYLVNKGELLFNRTNSKKLVGKSAVYREDKPMAFAGYLIKLITDSPATSEYVAAHLNSKYGKMYLSNMAKNIVGMANINAKEVQRIPILIPPMELRIEYAKIISQIESTKKLQKKSSHEINTLFNALMQKAFKGDLIH